ncbi:ribonuclease Y [Ruminiclostridium hungatei]|uniref:bis(5'-nucleosyl)-tetraphosphatase (symmetrical) n=1 Tax=Ruminiclostridium hungatei TaxID=48256 RepID=A0A1V4SFY6_RUMHU|nr:bis(5'-nucleosyl)-tetraphosphatase (symmetrical) YqeK [Ruminiclostridium hungatei]OPX42832.1 ribonuclease Y [Ruminiclostridium hungatei]
MKLDQMDILLKQALKPGRYVHSVNTMKEAVRLAGHYGEDVDSAAIAGLLHDCAKNLNDEQTLEYCSNYGINLSRLEQKQVFLMHGAVGAVIAREKYGVENEAVLNAIKYHTTGYGSMSMLDKIILLADFIEPGRKHSEVDNARKLAYIDINRALISAFDSTIRYVMNRKGLIHPSTIEARNNILMLISYGHTDLEFKG